MRGRHAFDHGATASTTATAARARATTLFTTLRVVGATRSRPTPAGDVQPDELERVQSLGLQDLEHVARARLAVDGEAPERRATGEHRARAERERLDDVRAAPDAAVDEHLDPAVDGVDDLGQRVDRRGDAVELPAAVVRDDDPRRAVLAGEPRVLGGRARP